MRTTILTVSGMQCGGCPIKLSLALRQVAGVDDVQISQASGEVTIVFDEARTSRAALVETIIRTGFGADGVAATDGHDPRPDHCG
jgi:copper chaperone CopZ